MLHPINSFLAYVGYFGSHNAYIGYLCLVALGLLGGIMIVGPKRVFEVRRIACIYYVFMFVTYWLRPFLEYVVARDFSFLMHIHEHYEPVAFSGGVLVAFGFFVGASLVVFGLAYRRFSPPDLTGVSIATDYPEKDLVRKVYWFFIGFGYFGFLLGGGGTMIVTEGGTGFTGTSGYLFMINYLVLVGATLRYATTGKLVSSFLIALPWFYHHLSIGFGRFIIITLLLVFGLIWLVRGGRIPIKKLLPFVPAALVILFFFNVLNHDRRAFSSMFRLKHAVQNTIDEPLHSYLHGFAGFAGGVLTLDRMVKGLDPPMYGTRLMYQTMVLPIPRALWSGKPFPPQFDWGFIMSGGKDREYSASYTELFYTWCVRGSIGNDMMEWGLIFFWINSLWVGLLAGFLERKCLVTGGHPILFVFYGVFLASFIYIGRSTLYDNIGPMAYALYFPLLTSFYFCAHQKGFRQPRELVAFGARRRLPKPEKFAYSRAAFFAAKQNKPAKALERKQRKLFELPTKKLRRLPRAARRKRWLKGRPKR